MKYFSVELHEAHDPTGIASASCRGCLCCGRVLSSMGGPGYWLCAECLTKMELGEVAIALGTYERSHTE